MARKMKHAMLAAVLAAAAVGGRVGGAGPGALPARLADAPANTWVKLADGQLGKRSSAALVYVPAEGRFVCLGGAMQMLPKHHAPYTEMTLDLAACRWENRFPKGKAGLWGPPVGPARAPGFAGSYYRVAMKDTEGNVRPYLGSGYDRAMFLYNNVAFDSHRRRIVVAWHLGAFTAEYDPAGRTWHELPAATDTPDGFWDDFLWGAMCYDPVHREVLGGRGRWAYSPAAGTWRRLTFANKALDAPRAAADALRRRTKDLVGALRSRYYVSESAEEAALRLDRSAEGIARDAAALAATLAAARGRAAGHDRTQLDWARHALAAARALLARTAALSARRPTADAIALAEDARDALERSALSLAAAPPPRAFSPMVYDAAARKIVLFGGDRMDRLLADTWVYDPADRSWQQRRPKLSPPPRAGHGLAYLPECRKVLLVDGYGCGKTGQSWLYDTARNEWSLLAEGAEHQPPRPTLTDRPHYHFLPGPLAAAPGDLAVMISHREFGGIATWAARIDATRVDPAAARRLGVGPLTMSTPAGASNPRWYEQAAAPPAGDADANLNDLPANTWTRLSPPNNPRLNRAWGTTVLDTARDQLIQWGGGHAAYCGNDPLHYSLRANRCSTGSFLPDTALNWNGSMLGPPITTTFAGRPHTPHGYHNYGYDPPTGKLVAFSRMCGNRFFAYDPHARGWRGGFGRAFPAAWKGNHNFTCVPTPAGLVVWATPTLLLRLNGRTMTWDVLPLKGKLPPMRVDHHGAAYDSRRDRLLLLSRYLKGDVVACDMKTGEVRPLGAAGGEHLHVFLREALYVPAADCLLAGTRHVLPDGSARWPIYDCATNRWLAVSLAGAGPIGGRRPKAEHNVSLGLSYDPKRKLIWAADARMTIHVLRLDVPTAAPRPLAEMPPPARTP